MPIQRVDIVVTERGTKIVRRRIDNVGTSASKAQGFVGLLKRTLASLSVARGPIRATRDVIQLNNAVKKTSPGVKGLQRNFASLRGTIVGLGIALVTREIVRMIDAYTELQNRLRIVTTGQQNLKDVTADLFDVANRTRASFEGTANLYARLSISAKNLGINQKDLLGFTETLNQAIVLSGASAKESEAALIQLSQGMASNTLRGDELRSVLEQLPVVADIISEHLGITRGELREFGKQGKISAQVVVDAMKEAGPRIAAAFATTIPTISGAFTVLRNNVSELLNKFNDASGIAEAFSRSIIFLAENLDIILPIITSLAFIIGVTLAAKAIPALIIAIGAATTSIRIFTASLLANPLTLIPTLIAIAIAALFQFEGAWKLVTGLITGYFTAMIDAIRVIWMAIVILWREGVAFFAEDFKKAGAIITGVMNFLRSMFDESIKFIVGLWDLLPKQITDTILFVVKKITQFINFLIRIINHVLSLLAKAIKLKQILAGIDANAATNAANNNRSNSSNNGNRGNSNSGNSGNRGTRGPEFSGNRNRGPDRNPNGATSSFDGRDSGLRGSIEGTQGIIGESGSFGGDAASRAFAGGGDRSAAASSGSAIGRIGGVQVFAKGGSFDVLGNAGVDRNTLSVNDRVIGRVSRDERITITPKGKKTNKTAKSGDTTNHFNIQITTPNPEGFRKSLGQMQSDIQKKQDRADRRNN